MTSLARFQVPQNEGLTGNSARYSPIINLENSSASNSAWPAKEPYREKEQSTDQTQNSMNSNTENTQWQRQQPNKGIYHERE